MTLAARLLAVARHHLGVDLHTPRQDLIGRTPASLTILSSGRTRTLAERRRRASKRTGAVVAARSVTTHGGKFHEQHR